MRSTGGIAKALFSPWKKQLDEQQRARRSGFLRGETADAPFAIDALGDGYLKTIKRNDAEFVG